MTPTDIVLVDGRQQLILKSGDCVRVTKLRKCQCGDNWVAVKRLSGPDRRVVKVTGIETQCLKCGCKLGSDARLWFSLEKFVLAESWKEAEQAVWDLLLELDIKS